MRPVGVKQNKRPPPQRLRVVSKARIVECWHIGPTVPSRAANNSNGDLFLLSAPRSGRERMRGWCEWQRAPDMLAFPLPLRLCSGPPPVGPALVFHVFRGCHQNMCSLQQSSMQVGLLFLCPSVRPSIFYGRGGGVWDPFPAALSIPIICSFLQITHDIGLFYSLFCPVYFTVSDFSPYFHPFFSLAVLVPLTRSVHQPATRILSLQSQIK